MLFGGVRHGVGGAGHLGESLADALAIGRVGLRAMGDVALLNGPRGGAELAGGVVEQSLTLGRRHQTEQVARLGIMVIVRIVVEVGGVAFERLRRLMKLGPVPPFPEAIGEVGRRSSQVAVRIAPSRW